MRQYEQEVDSLKKELMKYLESQDIRAVSVIRKLRRLALEHEDIILLGYVYYRFAYYYYFTDFDISRFRKYLPLAIKYLLRSGDKEFLGGVYNLVAYDAQDQGAYDIAYAYFMIAVRTSRQVKGIALPGLIEASAGRLLLELGEYKKGRSRLRHALSRIKKFTSMHVYNYNMILTYTDCILASFLLKDKEGMEADLAETDRHYAECSEGEIVLSRTYHSLSHIYYTLLAEDEEGLSRYLDELLGRWEGLPFYELGGLIFEIESLCVYMLEHGLTQQAKRLLRATSSQRESANLTVASRFQTLLVRYYEKSGDRDEFVCALKDQYRIRKKQKAEAMLVRRYAMEFSDMMSDIARERENAREENLRLNRRANTDVLTGLPNRNAINRYLQEVFEEAQKSSSLFGIGLIDVDQFKQYNDRFGHQEGDKCLRMLGDILLAASEDSKMFCARYGGDEFVVAYMGMSDEEIERKAADIARQVESGIICTDKGEEIKMMISQGIYNAVPKGEDRFRDFLELADKKLYEIKKSKKVMR